MGKLIVLSLIFFSFQAPSFCREILIPMQKGLSSPYFTSPQLTVDSSEYDTIVLQLEAKAAGTARIFWANHYDPKFNQQKSILFFIKPGQHNYHLNIPSQNPNWLGWIQGLLLLPDIELNIKEVKLVKGNLSTNIMSGWQEFWGPRGRLVIGSTINTIQSTNLFGRSIFYYIYWGFSFAMLFLVIKQFKGGLNLARLGRQAFFIIIVAWILLEINTWYNDWL
ncbi:MAG: hypothetical protein KJ811_01715, partial [Candidatus Margulisbacteria bacterium]|nr:hypothetical protein [Candidatus Margulisiibacteriota bacterium]